jgi:hypothetical protein
MLLWAEDHSAHICYAGGALLAIVACYVFLSGLR